MEPSLSQRIAEREAQKGHSKNSKNKVAFLALKRDIDEALTAGWSMKAIWETLFDEKKIEFTYKTFATYVSQLILSGESKKSEIKMTKDGKMKESNDNKGIPAFAFRPTPNPEELL